MKYSQTVFFCTIRIRQFARGFALKFVLEDICYSIYAPKRSSIKAFKVFSGF